MVDFARIEAESKLIHTTLAPGIVKITEPDGSGEPVYHISSELQKMSLTMKAKNEVNILLTYLLSIATSQEFEATDIEIIEAAIWESAQFVALQHYTKANKYEILRVRMTYSLAEHLANKEISN